MHFELSLKRKCRSYSWTWHGSWWSTLLSVFSVRISNWVKNSRRANLGARWGYPRRDFHIWHETRKRTTRFCTHPGRQSNCHWCTVCELPPPLKPPHSIVSSNQGESGKVSYSIPCDVRRTSTHLQALQPHRTLGRRLPASIQKACWIGKSSTKSTGTHTSTSNTSNQHQ